MPIDYAALNTEITTDPRGYGYAAPLAAGNHTGVANLLNQVRAGVSVDRTLIASHEIFEAIVQAEWDALTTLNKDRVRNILSMGQVNAKGANTRAAFIAAFEAGTATRANLVALLARQGSRAEELFGEGTSISHLDVAAAVSV